MTDTVTIDTLTTAPPTLRRLESEGALALVALSAQFEDLQTVLRCCERLVTALDAAPDDLDDVLIEGTWTMALLSYTRCFTSGKEGVTLAAKDLDEIALEGKVLDWHNVLIALRDHYASATVNPRELFSVGVAQDARGEAEGVAITGARQPLVSLVSVRQTGALALALSDLVDGRISVQQQKVSGQLAGTPKAVLDLLPLIEVAPED
ncbi:hypothetical protein BH09ACT6_BH09ACT6_22250 [soil metagenome]